MSKVEVLPKELVTELEVKDALELIVIHKEVKALNYAISYANAGLDMTGKELQIQVLYVLNNMSGWRGDVAKRVRETLKKFSKQK